VVKFLLSFSFVESSLYLLRTKEIHDLIINHVALHVTAIEKFGFLICSIVYQNKSSADFFANVESFSAILKCFHRSKNSDDARWIATSFDNILEHNPSSNELLNSLPVVEAFSFIIPLANDENSVKWTSNAVLKILDNNEEVQKKFGTPEFLKIFQGMGKYAVGCAAKQFCDYVIDMLKPIVERGEE
jgi:hypothetical protein